MTRLCGWPQREPRGCDGVRLSSEPDPPERGIHRISKAKDLIMAAQNEGTLEPTTNTEG